MVAKNDMGRYHGHSPAEWAQGRKRKLPLDLLQTEEPLGAMSLVDSEEAYMEKLNLQNATRRAFEQGRSKESILRALNARNRPTRGPFTKGDRVWWWSRTKRAALRSGGHVGGHKLGSWKGPATVLAQQGSIVWLSYYNRFLRGAGIP